MLRGATEAARTSRVEQAQTRPGGRAEEGGEFAGRKVTAGGVAKVVARVVAAVLTLGLSEVGIALYKRSVRQETAPPGSDRAHRALAESTGPAVGEALTLRLAGEMSPAFNKAVEAAINRNVLEDLAPENAGKFESNSVHGAFHADADRSTYILNGRELAKDKGVVEAAFATALGGDEELRAATAVLHQGTLAPMLEELTFGDEGPVKGLLGGPRDADPERGIPGKETILTLTRDDDNGRISFKIENLMPVNSRMSEEGESWYDPARSHLNTTMTGTIHPGEDPCSGSPGRSSTT